MTMMVKAALIVTGGSLLAGKIASNRAKDPKAAIGSGTAPSLSSGVDLELTPIQGSQLREFGDFDVENVLEPEGMENDPAQIMAMFAEAGLSPEDLGIASLALGGPLYRANGGGIGSLLMEDEKIQKLKEMIEMFKNRPDMTSVADVVANVSKPEVPTDFNLDIASATSLVPDIKDTIDPADSLVQAEFTPMQETMIGVENFAESNPELFMAGLGAAKDVIMALLADNPEPKGMQVSTRTLPPAGNANRRRLQFDPIGMKEGGDPNKVLDRKMFTPMLGGGELDGPGGPKDDLIPIMGSDGEFMLSKATVDLVGKGDHNKGIKTLEKLNNKGNRMYG